MSGGAAGDEFCSGEVEFREIAYGDVAYLAALELRHRVLRVPLGLAIWEEDLDGEAGQLHYGLFGGGEGLVACLSAVPLTGGEAKLRQMAVCPREQGRGLGACLLGQVELALAVRGLCRLRLHARDSALGFYLKQGYRVVGEGFREVGLPHHLMLKFGVTQKNCE